MQIYKTERSEIHWCFLISNFSCVCIFYIYPLRFSALPDVNKFRHVQKLTIKSRGFDREITVEVKLEVKIEILVSKVKRWKIDCLWKSWKNEKCGGGTINKFLRDTGLSLENSTNSCKNMWRERGALRDYFWCFRVRGTREVSGLFSRQAAKGWVGGKRGIAAVIL